ncbi:MAG: macro domain-containing protein [Nitrospinales bacterium]
MISKVHGDILLSEAKAIAHGIAPHDHFDQGLALSLRERFPAMVKDFRHYCHQQNPKPGNAWLWAGAEKVVINLMTQEPAPANRGHPGKASIQHINHALKSLCGIIEEQGISSIALPRLATGVGGLEWSDVEPLIEKYLGNLKIPVIIYDSYIKGEKAVEKLP